MNIEESMYKKDDIVQVKITDMGMDGEGIGKIDAFPFFIKDAVIGDLVEIKVIKAKKNYAYGRLMNVIEPSHSRVAAKCPVARACGGCQIQEMDYKAQLEFKERKVFNNLLRIGGISKDILEKCFEPIMGMEDPWRYRNKAQYPVSRDKNGKVIAGFYAGRTHSVIACEDCLIGPENHRIILKTITDWMDKNQVDPYDEKDGSGIVRHILIREGFKTGQVMVVLVVNYKIDKFKAKLIENLVSALSNVVPGIQSIQLNENMEKTNVILDRSCRVIYGSETIEDVLCGLKFKISPLSFYQVNPIQTEKLYGTAIEFANLSGEEEVWDLCCGIGTITLALAKKLEDNRMDSSEKSPVRVHGIEIVPQAIENAKENARANNLANVDFLCAPAEEYLPAHKGKIRADVIVTDPPRKGMDERALEVMVNMEPQRIVYVSCDSATLARDVKYLLANGYELNRVRACDMFPHSVHVETVVLITRKDK